MQKSGCLSPGQITNLRPGKVKSLGPPLDHMLGQALLIALEKLFAAQELGTKGQIHSSDMPSTTGVAVGSERQSGQLGWEISTGQC